MTIANALTIIEQSEDYRVIKRFKGLPASFKNKQQLPLDSKVYRACFLDTETTGLDTNQCEIIDVAIKLVEFDAEGNFYSVLGSYQSFQQPSEPLSEEVKKVTGYTDELLAGHQIDWITVENLVKDCNIVVAYNSRFDRPVLERYCNVFSQLNWGCAMLDIPWFDYFGTKGKLEWLAYKVANLYFDAHQAMADVDITVYLLSLRTQEDGKTLLADVLDAARIKRYYVRAEGSPFDAKDLLKSRGYRWEADEVAGHPKAWCKIIEQTELLQEKQFLDEINCRSPIAGVIKPKQRFRTEPFPREKMMPMIEVLL
jgi:DNA polymerase-3 subunit epsilon